MSKTTRVLFAAVACAFVVTQATAQDAAAPSVSVGGGLRAGAQWGDGDDPIEVEFVREERGFYVFKDAEGLQVVARIGNITIVG